MRAARLCLLVLILPPGLQAGQAASLGDAVRDQYVEEISPERAAQVQDSGSLQLLDDYSHYLDDPAPHAAAGLPSAFVLAMPDGGLYLRIPVFHAGTPSQVEAGLQRFASQNPKGPVLVDLRGNPGGLLNAAVEVADIFIAQGELAETHGRSETANLVFMARPGDRMEGRRLAVLVDAGTASSAELLAGILRLNAGAILVGRATYGKSAVQSRIALDDGKALSLTTARYRFADGSTVGPDGLAPDVPLTAWVLRRKPPSSTAGLDSARLLDQDAAVRKAWRQLVDRP